MNAMEIGLFRFSFLGFSWEALLFVFLGLSSGVLSRNSSIAIRKAYLYKYFKGSIELRCNDSLELSYYGDWDIYFEASSDGCDGSIFKR